MTRLGYYKGLGNTFSYQRSQNIWIVLKNVTFAVKTALDNIWQVWWKIGLFFIPISGHIELADTYLVKGSKIP